LSKGMPAINASMGHMRMCTAGITVKRPHFGFETVAGTSSVRTHIKIITSMVLGFEGRIEILYPKV
jgi:hypothetical protein